MNIIYDIEVYPNFFCMAILKKGRIYCYLLDQIQKLPFSDPNVKWIGFNNRRYDHPIIKYALQGASHSDLFELSKSIIYDNVNAIVWDENIIDLLEICPKMSKCSLKEFGHRLQYPTLANLPYSYDKALAEDEMRIVKYYCKHDVLITQMLWEKLESEYDAREGLKLFFDVKTAFGGAPRLAEKCILSELGDDRISVGSALKQMDNVELSPSSQYLYDQAFQLSTDDYISKNRPSFMEESQSINGAVVDFGVGGLHALGKKGVFNDVYEYDVSSYYPSIILNCKLGSPHFRAIYKKIYDRRLRLKKSKNPQANSLKLVLNSLYGKFNDKYASDKIFAPNLALTICLLGQFYLVDLMEKLPLNSIILANTDSVIIDQKISKSVLKEWEERTAFKLECTHYKKFICKDVNSVYGIQDGGYEKRKKEFLEPLWTHNVRASIIQKAVINYLFHNIPLQDTIRSEDVLYNFCFFVKTKGKAHFLINGKKIEDKRCRYYCSLEGDVLERQTEKTKAKIKSDTKITLAMTLEKSNEINYDWYLKEAQKLVNHICS